MTSGLTSRAFLAGGSVAALAYFLVSADLAQAVIFTALQAAALVALIIGIRHHQPKAKWAWLALGAGLVLYLAGSLVWYVYQVAADVALPYPSLSDALFVPAYMLLLVGIGGLIWNRSGRADAGSIIDAGIIGIAVAVLAWEFLVQNYLSDPNLSGLGRGVSIAYPTIDALIVALLALLIFVPGRRAAAFWLLGIGLVGQLVADIVYSFSVLAGNFEFGAPYFVGWMLFYVCLGAAMLHPSMPLLSQPQAHRGSAPSRWRVAFLGAAAMLPLVILGLNRGGLAPEVGPAEGIALLLAAAVMFALVLFRMGGLLVDLAESRRIERLKNEFVSVVSHELRTPLTSIRGALGLVAGGAMGPLPGKAKHMVEIASQNADRLVRLVNDILDVERMESGKVQMEMRTCSVSELFARSVEEMQPLADETGVRLTVEPAEASVIADPDRIVQTITNLLSNAIKFSPPDTEVRVTAFRDPTELRVAVADEGPGIPAKHLSKIFDRFQQVDPSDSRDKGGTGLGLAICKSIVDHHGGRIWADSEEGLGTTFYFTLPAVESMSQVPASGRPRILVCDDDPGALEVVCTMLQSRGYDAIAASNGREAIEKAIREEPELVLLDLLMTGMTGWDTLASLQARDQTRDIPVVILSVLDRAEGRLPESEVAGWITKPVTEDSLFSTVRRALAEARRHRRVLLVEPDLDLAEVLTTALRTEGISVYHASTVESAAKIAYAITPDLVALALMLPDGDGRRVVAALRKDERLRTTPLIVYTVKDLDRAEREELRLGPTQFLTKGRVNVEQFQACVNELLKKTRTARDDEVVRL